MTFLIRRRRAKKTASLPLTGTTNGPLSVYVNSGDNRNKSYWASIFVFSLFGLFLLVSSNNIHDTYPLELPSEGQRLSKQLNHTNVNTLIGHEIPENSTPADQAGEHQGNKVQCKCLNCEEDKTCGGLWKGNRYEHKGLDDLTSKKIHIIVSHCKSELDWIPQFVKGYNVESIHVISKCGETVNGAPEMATIEVLPNVGRCDHTYAYYINNVLEKKVKKNEEQDSIVVFLKDDISVKNMHHQSGVWNDFESLLWLAASDNGFGCGIIPGSRKGRFFPSVYHDTKTLFKFTMSEYRRNNKGYAKDATEFQNPDYESLGSWYTSLNAGPSPSVVQVCYGGAFSASVANIMKRDMAVWSAVEKSLSRGNNILEGHFAERSWANLLATPLQPFQVKALLAKSEGINTNIKMMGFLYVQVQQSMKKKDWSLLQQLYL